MKFKIREETKKKIIVIQIIFILLLSTFVTSLFITKTKDKTFESIIFNTKKFDDSKHQTHNSEYKKTGSNDTYEPPENQPPRSYATAHPRKGMAPLDVRFTANAYDPDGWITHMSWYITGPNGFSEYSYHWSPEFTLETPGEYRARLIVRDDDWNTDVSHVYINVYDPSKPARVEMNKHYPFPIKLVSYKINFVNQENQKIEDIDYKITITGGLINRLNKKETGTIDIEANENIFIETPRVWFALGRATLKIEFEIPDKQNIEEEHTLFYMGNLFLVV